MVGLPGGFGEVPVVGVEVALGGHDRLVPEDLLEHVQGDAGRRLLADNGLDPDDPVSFLLVEYDRDPSPRVSTDTDAMRLLYGNVLALGGGSWAWA